MAYQGGVEKMRGFQGGVEEKVDQEDGEKMVYAEDGKRRLGLGCVQGGEEEGDCLWAGVEMHCLVGLFGGVAVAVLFGLPHCRYT